jgi:hypothetical protein
MVGYDFGMHQTGVLLDLLMLLLVLGARATAVSRLYLGESCKR